MGAPAEPPASGVAAPAPAPLPLDDGTPDAWIPRDARLLRNTGRHPLNCEATLADLAACGPITSPALHFVRNHGAVPRREWGAHTVAVGGLVDDPVTLSMDDLVAMPARTVTVTMACAGNRRKEQNMFRKSQVRGGRREGERERKGEGIERGGEAPTKKRPPPSPPFPPRLPFH